MKKNKILSFGLLLLFGVSIASCDSCNKKNDPDATQSTYLEADTTLVASDTTAMGSEEGSGTEYNSNANSGKSSSRTTATKAKTSDSSMEGYSAPDGTDAENTDGDQYTRNDETPRPTGPPIK